MVRSLTYWISLVLLGVVSIGIAEKIRVGIIGAGIGGTSTCYFLHQLLGDVVDIDVYEPYDIGGRLSTTQIGDSHYETGGSIILEENFYVRDFMKRFNLTKKVDKATNVPSKFGLYDGSQFLFKEAKYTWMTLAKMAYRYGPVHFYGFKKAVDAMVKDFSRIYTLQKENNTFLTVESMLRAMSPRFVPQLKKCAKEGMKAVVSQRLLDEIVSAGNLVNYGQTVNNMPEFVTYVSCAGMVGELFAIDGGNKQLATHLLNACSGNLLRRKVAKIVHHPETGTYVVHSLHGNAEKLTENNFQENSHPKNPEENFRGKIPTGNSHSQNPDENSHGPILKEYDYVVLATPLSLADIAFENVDERIIRGQKRVQYHTTVTTLVQGEVNTTLTSGGEVNEILLTSTASFYNSLSLLSSTSGNNTGLVHKVFSQRQLTRGELDQLFQEGKYEVKYQRDWRAYPEYNCEEGFFEGEHTGNSAREGNDESAGKIDDVIESVEKVFESVGNLFVGKNDKKGVGNFEGEGKIEGLNMEDYVKRRAREMEDYLREKVSDIEDFLRMRAKEREKLMRDFFKRTEAEGVESQDVWDKFRTFEGTEREFLRQWEEFVWGNMREWELYVLRNAREWRDFVKRNFTEKNPIPESFDVKVKDKEGNVGDHSDNDAEENIETTDNNKYISINSNTEKIEKVVLISSVITDASKNEPENCDSKNQNSHCPKKGNNLKKNMEEEIEDHNIEEPALLTSDCGENCLSSKPTNGDINCAHDSSGSSFNHGDNSYECGKNNFDCKENSMDAENPTCEKYKNPSCGKNKNPTDGKNPTSGKNKNPSAVESEKSSINSFVLDKGLYYVNVIEVAASAMEMSAIGARNVALLIAKEVREGEG